MVLGKRRQHGFTFVELLVAVVLLAIVLTTIFRVFALADFASREQKIGGRMIAVVEYQQNWLQIAPYDRILSILTVDGVVQQKVTADSGVFYTNGSVGYTVVYRVLSYDNAGTPDESLTLEVIVSRTLFNVAPNHSDRQEGRAPSVAATTPLHATVTRRKF